MQSSHKSKIGLIFYICLLFSTIYGIPTIKAQSSVPSDWDITAQGSTDLFTFLCWKSALPDSNSETTEGGDPPASSIYYVNYLMIKFGADHEQMNVWGSDMNSAFMFGFCETPGGPQNAGMWGLAGAGMGGINIEWWVPNDKMMNVEHNLPYVSMYFPDFYGEERHYIGYIQADSDLTYRKQIGTLNEAVSVQDDYEFILPVLKEKGEGGSVTWGVKWRQYFWHGPTWASNMSFDVEVTYIFTLQEGIGKVRTIVELDKFDFGPLSRSLIPTIEMELHWPMGSIRMGSIGDSPLISRSEITIGDIEVPQAMGIDRDLRVPFPSDTNVSASGYEIMKLDLGEWYTINEDTEQLPLITSIIETPRTDGNINDGGSYYIIQQTKSLGTASLSSLVFDPEFQFEYVTPWSQTLSFSVIIGVLTVMGITGIIQRKKYNIGVKK